MAGHNYTTIDFGSTLTDNNSFVITDTNIVSTSVVEAFVMVDSTTNNSVDDHRHAAVSWKMSALPATGSFTLYIDNLLDLCNGQFKIRYAWV